MDVSVGQFKNADPSVNFSLIQDAFGHLFLDIFVSEDGFVEVFFNFLVMEF